MSRKLFCDICPAFYEIALRKEIMKRHIKDAFSDEKYAKIKSEEKLPNVLVRLPQKHYYWIFKEHKIWDINKIGHSVGAGCPIFAYKQWKP